MIRKVVKPGLEFLGLESLTLPLMPNASLYTTTRSNPVPFHAYPVFEFHYLHTGHLTWEIEDGSILHIRGGDVSVVQPNTRHRSAHDVDAPSIFLALCLDPDSPFPSLPFATREEQADAFRILREAGNRVVHGCPGLDDAFRSLRNTARRIAHLETAEAPSDSSIPQGDAFHGTPAGYAYVRGLLHQVFLGMLRSLAVPVRTPRFAPVDRALRHIQEHLGKNLSVNEIARAAAVSKSRLHALFYEQTGENPAEYALRLRLERSMRLLRAGELSVTAIAQQMAFSSSQNFARSFRKHFGLTPTAYRKQAQE